MAGSTLIVFLQLNSIDPLGNKYRTQRTAFFRPHALTVKVVTPFAAIHISETSHDLITAEEIWSAPENTQTLMMHTNGHGQNGIFRCYDSMWKAAESSRIFADEMQFGWCCGWRVVNWTAVGQLIADRSSVLVLKTLLPLHILCAWCSTNACRARHIAPRTRSARDLLVEMVVGIRLLLDGCCFSNGRCSI